MDEDLFNMELRRFLKTVGVTGQREIEEAVRAAVARGALTGTEPLEAKAVLTIERIGFEHSVSGTIKLS
jgi:hypothetical protein